MRRLLHGLIHGTAGFVLGGALGFLLALGAAQLSVALHPDDPSAGSIGIIIIGTAPLGAMLGTVAGFVAGLRGVKNRPRLEQPYPAASTPSETHEADARATTDHD